MRTIGIISEYNPFHNGHKYLIDQAKKHVDGQYIVCVLSSNFLQRGEPSIISKFERAKLAVLNGADLVFELPTVNSCINAKSYAYNSLNLLNKVGICDTLLFGSEAGNTNILNQISDVLINEPSSFKKELKMHLASGVSYPKARSLALQKHFNNSDISGIIKSSNNILGIEYINAIKELSSPIKFDTIKRIGSSYLNENLEVTFSSATAIRKSILDKGISSIKSQVPTSTYDLLSETFSKYDLVTTEKLDEIMNYRLASLNKNDIYDFQNISEGIENRIFKMLDKHLTFNEMVTYLSSKRYPKTRISRLLIHILLDIKKNQLDTDIKYARILYASEKGKDLFNVINKNSIIPVFTSYNKFYNIAPNSIKKLLDFEIKASNIYESLRKGMSNSDFKHKFEIIKSS